MIHLECDGCGQAFEVPEKFAGKSGKCKKCGATLRVPQLATAGAPGEADVAGANCDEQAASNDKPRKLPPRTRRLLADSAQIEQAFQDHPIITVTPDDGDPAEAYNVHYNMKSLVLGKDGKPQEHEGFDARIELTLDYPRLSPNCKMLSPIFHPNIDQTTICVGDHWVAGERLADLIVRIGEIIGYQAYNIKSPLNAEAAMWADLNTADLPIDSRDLDYD